MLTPAHHRAAAVRLRQFVRLQRGRHRVTGDGRGVAGDDGTAASSVRRLSSPSTMILSVDLKKVNVRPVVSRHDSRSDHRGRATARHDIPLLFRVVGQPAAASRSGLRAPWSPGYGLQTIDRVFGAAEHDLDPLGAQVARRVRSPGRDGARALAVRLSVRQLAEL